MRIPRTLQIARHEAVIAVIAAVAASLILPTPGARATAATAAPPRHVSSLSHEPGYVPLVDPESTSVLLGRRPNAPRVSKRFKGGARSMADFGRTVCRILHRSDRDSMLALCITDDEFRDILWPEFPQSRPATGLRYDDAWKILYARIHAGSLHALRDLGGHVYEFVGIENDSITVYKNFRLHSGFVMVVHDDVGQIQRWRWLRSIAERKGRFKIYSTED